MRASIPTLVLALAFTPMTAQGSAPPKAESQDFTKYSRLSVRYDVNADGTHVETHDWEMKVVAEQGISRANRASFTYSDSLQESEILAAYTLKADGRRVDAPASNFQNNVSSGEGSAPPMFSDWKTRSVVFPEVSVGDSVVFTYRVKQKEATFPGKFSTAEWFSKFVVYDEAEVVLTAPRSLDIRVQARGVSGGKVEDASDRQTWRWTYHNSEPSLPEAGAVSAFDYGPLIVASTFRDYEELATAYNDRAQPKAAVTESIRKLAEELTKEASTPREEARILSEWVAKSIKFAGNCVGKGSVVPHEADQVLLNRMGDCKDHTVLLQALLSAKGIESTPALINAGSTYTLPEVPVASVFNHVINYIPSLDLYVDTAAQTEFGRLPVAEYDKPVLLTASADPIQRTPAADPTLNQARSATKIDVHADGRADGETRIALAGAFAGGTKQWMDHLQPHMEEQLMRHALSERGYLGTGGLIREDTSDALDRFAYGARYELYDAINLPGPGAMYLHAPFSGAISVSSFLMNPNEPPRTVPYACYGGSVVEEYTVTLPDNVELLAVPRDVALQGRYATYSATYRSTGNTVTVVREIDDRTPGSVCTPEDQAAEKPFALAVLRDLRSQVVYK